MAALIVSLRPSLRVQPAFSKRWKPYSRRAGAFVSSATDGSALLITGSFSSHPANCVGRTAVGAGASAAHTALQRNSMSKRAIERVLYIPGWAQEPYVLRLLGGA